ncbi:hypothetical protein NDU88_001108 [Pleurodeles waltl]|uniref:Uncharacterized protein n=1 Tax=Pleurodeles waltl TaxID=8319 RepID=A0AAV7URV4_PLEWA|nr:hypothetical protein NDU88_001108 [Pleurodeles waltl]
MSEDRVWPHSTPRSPDCVRGTERSPTPPRQFGASQLDPACASAVVSGTPANSIARLCRRPHLFHSQVGPCDSLHLLFSPIFVRPRSKHCRRIWYNGETGDHPERTGDRRLAGDFILPEAELAMEFIR